MQPDVNIKSANWQSLTETPTDAGPSEGGAQADGGDEVWKSFKSIAEQKQQRVRAWNCYGTMLTHKLIKAFFLTLRRKSIERRLNR